jgi:hypothetical protein
VVISRRLVSRTSVISFMSAALSGPYWVWVSDWSAAGDLLVAGAALWGGAIAVGRVAPQDALDNTAMAPHTANSVARTGRSAIESLHCKSCMI